jgi:hypothetical protein
MARTLQQLDTAVAALETQLPKVNAGLMETLRQTALALESEYTTITSTLGAPADGNGVVATGLYSTLASLQASLADVQSALTVIDSTLTSLQTQVDALQSN